MSRPASDSAETTTEIHSVRIFSHQVGLGDLTSGVGGTCEVEWRNLSRVVGNLSSGVRNLSSGVGNLSSGVEELIKWGGGTYQWGGNLSSGDGELIKLGRRILV